MGKTRINTAADDLRLELQDAALSLRCAYDRFNHVTDPELVEASIYEINSLQARYNYLLRRAKALHGYSFLRKYCRYCILYLFRLNCK